MFVVYEMMQKVWTCFSLVHLKRTSGASSRNETSVTGIRWRPKTWRSTGFHWLAVLNPELACFISDHDASHFSPVNIAAHQLPSCVSSTLIHCHLTSLMRTVILILQIKFAVSRKVTWSLLSCGITLLVGSALPFLSSEPQNQHQGLLLTGQSLSKCRGVNGSKPYFFPYPVTFSLVLLN